MKRAGVRLIDRLARSRRPALAADLRGELLLYNRAGGGAIGAGPVDGDESAPGVWAPREPSRWRMPIQELLKKSTAGRPHRCPDAKGRPARWTVHVELFARPRAAEPSVILTLKPCRG